MSTYEQFQAVKSRGATPAAGDAGVPMIGIRKDTQADLAGADGKYTFPQFDAIGNMRIAAIVATAVGVFLGVVGKSAVVGSSMTRPADTNGYTAGDLFGTTTSNSSTNIFTLPVARVNDATAVISRIRAKVHGSSAWAGKRIKFHFFKVLPTVTSIGDNGAFANGTVCTESNKIGTAMVNFDSNQTSDGYVKGFTYPDDTAGVLWTVDPSTGTQNIFAIAEVLDAVTPGSGDTLTLTLETVAQN